MDYSIFQERLKQLMDSRGLNINALADAVGFTPPTISRYLSGVRTPDLSYVIKLSELFDVSIDWLIGLNGDRYEILPQDIQDIVFLYSLASPDDRMVIHAVLSKYKQKNKG